MLDQIVKELSAVARKSRVFVSMPWVEGLTPEFLGREGAFEVAGRSEGLERRHGIYPMNVASLSTLDHGGLYGDGCFEGILINNNQVFLYKEHLVRWFEGAQRLGIKFPYTMEDIGWQIMRTIQAVGFADNERGYLRPVLTRGFGNLGINPKKCLAPTIYCVVSTIQLYPPEAYDRGIELSIARHVRRPSPEVLDPNVKGLNYLNNIRGLMETAGRGTLETLMLTKDGYVAEATADNIFLIKREGDGTSAGDIHIYTPITDYCLAGITRAQILKNARAMGFTIHEVPDMLPSDLIGAGKEAFMTGTGCGLMPVVGLEGNAVGDGKPGEITKRLLAAIREDMADSRYGVSMRATREEYMEYMSRS